MKHGELRKIIENSTNLLVNRPSLTLIGMVYYGLKKVYATGDDFYKWCKKDGVRGPCLGYTDGNRIVFYIPEENFDMKEFIFVASHEVLHVISDHIERGVGKYPYLWNIATDHVVNRLCMQLGDKNGLMKMPEHSVFFEDLHHKDPNVSSEDVYKYLLENVDRYEIDVVEMDCAGDGDSNQNGGNGDDGDNSNDSDKNGSDKEDRDKPEHKRKKVIRVKDKHTGKTYYGMNDTDVNDLDKDPSDTRDKIREIKETAQSVWRSNSISKGDVPGSFAAYLDDIFKIEIPWNEILNEAILYPVTACQRSTWTWPNIYIRTPRLTGKKRNRNADILIAVVDSSGSVGDDELKKFLGVICSSHSYFNKIIVIIHDHIIQQEIKIEGIVTEKSIFEKIRAIRGRGGTSHEDVFNRIDELAGFEKISSVVFLTDYYSDVENIYDRYTFIKTFPSTWVITNNNNTEVVLDGCECRTIHI